MYKTAVQSAVGYWIIHADDENIVSLSLEKSKPSFIEDENPHLLKAKKQLQEYFNEGRKTFDLPFKKIDKSSFTQRVLNVVAKIPYGKTSSYTDIALEIGDLKSIRAVGTANGRNPLPIFIPCHRVIGKNKTLTGYALGLDVKRWLLEKEGALAIQTSLF